MSLALVHLQGDIIGRAVTMVIFFFRFKPEDPRWWSWTTNPDLPDYISHSGLWLNSLQFLTFNPNRLKVSFISKTLVDSEAYFSIANLLTPYSIIRNSQNQVSPPVLSFLCLHYCPKIQFAATDLLFECWGFAFLFRHYNPWNSLCFSEYWTLFCI